MRLGLTLTWMCTVAGIGCLVAPHAMADSLPPPTYEPCESLHMYVPAPSFPAGFVSHVRLSMLTIDENGAVPPDIDRFEPSEPFRLERETAAGWEEVPYTLADRAGLVTGARELVLEDPRPGRYVASWSPSTCGEPLAPSGAGPMIGEFTLTEDVPFPTGAPVLTRVEWAGVEEREYETVDGRDETTVYQAVVGETALEFELPADWEPWLSVTTVGAYLGGDLAGRVYPSEPGSKVYEGIIDTLCAADDPEALSSRWSFDGPPTGEHVVHVTASVDRYVSVSSEGRSYEAQCPAIDGADGADGAGEGGEAGEDGGFGPDASRSSGCATAARRPGAAWAWLGLLGLGLVSRGRRRR